MAFLKVAEFRKPDGSEDLACELRLMAEDAESGKLVSLVFVAVAGDGAWVTGSRGRRQDTLVTVGMLEGLKLDVLQAAVKDSG